MLVCCHSARYRALIYRGSVQLYAVPNFGLWLPVLAVPKALMAFGYASHAALKFHACY